MPKRIRSVLDNTRKNVMGGKGAPAPNQRGWKTPPIGLYEHRDSYSFSKSFKYWPYPAFSKSSFGMNFKEAEFMQYLKPVGSGPSLKT